MKNKIVLVIRLSLAVIVCLPGAVIALLAFAIKVAGILIRGAGEAIDEGRHPFYWLADKVAGEVKHG